MRTFYNSYFYVADLPPTISLIPAKKSLNTFALKFAFLLLLRDSLILFYLQAPVLLNVPFVSPFFMLELTKKNI